MESFRVLHRSRRDETGVTFEENAIQKALYYSKHCEGYLFVDDSGLEVDALGGAPGVYSARFAGPQATMRQQSAAARSNARPDGSPARFVCVVALAESGRLVRTFRGEVEGRLTEAPQEPTGSATIRYSSMRRSDAPSEKRRSSAKWK